jgi:hypothetical protein
LARPTEEQRTRMIGVQDDLGRSNSLEPKRFEDAIGVAHGKNQPQPPRTQPGEIDGNTVGTVGSR